MEPKYNFYDSVIITSNKYNNVPDFIGHEGYIRGRAQSEETGEWFYGIRIDNYPYILYMREEELAPTGKIEYIDESVPIVHARVSHDGKLLEVFTETSQNNGVDSDKQNTGK